MAVASSLVMPKSLINHCPRQKILSSLPFFLPATALCRSSPYLMAEGTAECPLTAALGRGCVEPRGLPYVDFR
jgi:hypothetical protein